MSINLEPIKAQLAKDIGGYICLHRDDMAGLISEIEHLRGDRAAVVAWLRKEAVSHRRDGFPIAAYTMQERADAIKRGEHRREEEQ